MSPSPILAQIRKLREIARRDTTNANEAATAAAIAEKLIAEHGIEEATLDAGEDDGTVPLDDHEPLDVMPSRGFVHWKSTLLSHLCDLHGCAHCYETDKGRRRAVFFGRREDVAIVRDLYGWIVDDIDRLAARARDHGESARWVNSYRMGCVNGICEAMLAAHEQARRGAPSTALAVLDGRLTEAQRALDEALQEGNAKRIKVKVALEEEAFEQGRADGWSVNAARKRRAGKEAQLRK